MRALNRIFVLVVLAVCSETSLSAHSLTITQVLVSVDGPKSGEVTIDIDLTAWLGSPDAYFSLSEADNDRQLVIIQGLLPGVLDSLKLCVGNSPLHLKLREIVVPRLARATFRDPATDKFTTLRLSFEFPGSHDALWLEVPEGAMVDYPVAFTVQVPSINFSQTVWIDDGSTHSELFDWAGLIPDRREDDGATHPTGHLSASQQIVWYRQLGTYLHLGFRHIIPEGADHILFVLGLFFLGLSWRKLLMQTTVFTVAHASTLFLSSYGIFNLPSRIVEPAIALSIAYVAIENIVRPRLGFRRFAVVFLFGLVHGLGFANSLSAVSFPRHDFIVALLGFNFGVDGGQLFVIAVAFLAVGAFRNRPWFRGRIAIPASLLIASVGLFWAVQRIVFYGRN